MSHLYADNAALSLQLRVLTMIPLNYNSVVHKAQREKVVRGHREPGLNSCQAAFAASLLFILTADGLQQGLPYFIKNNYL